MGIHFLSKKLLPLFTIVTLVITLLVFFNKPYNVNAQKQMNFSSEEIYKGIVFGQGEVAKLFPQVWDEKNLEIANEKENKELASKLIKEMKSTDPTYFKRLNQTIKKKDPGEIKQVLENGNILLNDSIEKLELKMQTQKYARQQGTGFGTLASGVVSLSYISPAILVVPVVTDKPVIAVDGFQHQNDLETEKLIKSIAETFSN
ncbi:sporulation delaying protein family toxin [Bacillus mycoides]|uniref:sporulation delaying protein family toxin n=1 Tax=Bacillus mycoides TaxID=1405 RepID=UPI0003E262C4|nr:sporulation delaying protein family toxin [Bacillus mycoides]ETT84690.1 hypothetical protein C174_02339 [Bacillus mycoides FSL H7-687]